MEKLAKIIRVYFNFILILFVCDLIDCKAEIGRILGNWAVVMFVLTGESNLHPA
jgi:hypothetical protein